MSLFPDQSLSPEEADAEALSPVLGHLIDLSLAVVLMERPLIVSPYSVSLNTGACLATSADHVLHPDLSKDHGAVARSADRWRTS